MQKVTLESGFYPRNITISKEDYTKIRPNKVPRRVDVYCAKKTGKTIPIEKDIAYFIVNQFSDIYVLDESGKRTEIKDDLDKLGVTELRKLISKWNKKVESIGMKKVNPLGISKKDAIEQIRDWRTLGVIL